MDDLEKIVKDINNAWLIGDFKRLESLFHEDMVIVSPDGSELGKGKEQCIQSYKEFKENAIILDFGYGKFQINIFHNTGIVLYSFNIEYKMNKETIKEEGKEIFVLNREHGNWVVVWRSIITS